jgi:hypothetical protein
MTDRLYSQAAMTRVTVASLLLAVLIGGCGQDVRLGRARRRP